MLKSYEAIYRQGQLRWLHQAPPIPDQELRVLVVAEIVEAKTPTKHNLHEVLQRAWGCLESGKTLDDLDRELQVMRHEWEREWDQ